MTIVLVVVIGALGGVLAGLFGVGGGILFVPTLVLVLGLTQLHAEASSLLAILPTAIVGTWRQRRYGNVDVRAAALIGRGVDRRCPGRGDRRRVPGGQYAAPALRRAPPGHLGAHRLAVAARIVNTSA